MTDDGVEIRDLAGNVFRPPLRKTVPALPRQTGPRLSRVNDDTWIDLSEVVMVFEEYFPGTDSYRVSVHTRYGQTWHLSDCRAADIVAGANGDLR